eukprot:1417981-Amphidinium_carterae.1
MLQRSSYAGFCRVFPIRLEVCDRMYCYYSDKLATAGCEANPAVCSASALIRTMGDACHEEARKHGRIQPQITSMRTTFIVPVWTGIQSALPDPAIALATGTLSHHLFRPAPVNQKPEPTSLCRLPSAPPS